jgi:hypothetical protein
MAQEMIANDVVNQGMRRKKNIQGLLLISDINFHD